MRRRNGIIRSHFYQNHADFMAHAQKLTYNLDHVLKT